MQHHFSNDIKLSSYITQKAVIPVSRRAHTDAENVAVHKREQREQGKQQRQLLLCYHTLLNTLSYLKRFALWLEKLKHG